MATINFQIQGSYGPFSVELREGSEAGSIMINGEFPIQNIAEGQYLLAAVYFFRAATKSS